jgi:hypothetical protein
LPAASVMGRAKVKVTAELEAESFASRSEKRQ